MPNRRLTPPRLWLFSLVLLVNGIGAIATAQAQVLDGAPPPVDARVDSRVDARFDARVVPSDYILGPGDELTISVFGYEEYNTGATVVEPNGTIALPIIGAVTVAGKTPEAVTQELTARLNYYLVNPVVTVTLTALRPMFVTVSGEVQRPGPIQLQNPNADTNDNERQTGLTTLSSALVEAGGVTSHADIRQVRLRRSLPNGTETVLTINLWDSLWSEASGENPLLQDGDTIFVPRLTADATIDPRLIARSTLAPDTVRVRVVGEVTKPGEVLVPPNSSLSSAVAIAGGPTVDARLSRTNFIRLNQEGVIEREEVDLSDLTDSYQVQDGDVIIVPKRNSSSILDLANRLLNPLNFIFQFLE
ncbi:MAG: polysaccharide export protein [Leptolyngbyaceae cyanobacterium SL_7_1]|nr:polysaccharide export protein [Leptolyngbyaceae cyanobacterium SL_7_1]